MYKAIEYFTDLLDNNYPYAAGDAYPRPGLDVTEQRLAELAGSENKRGMPLIRLVGETPKDTPKKAPAKRAKKTTDM